ncbi:glycine cleavage T C-terminal barrel domain-containing protein [Leifsonia sp. F6_8S_P_1B]|uniref:Glycine cleavage T C-terminal barrel domain-containing protein n=1 Tax=Leifsonia williamsii TaxID=3035919 RepID=A0ABT8KF43_9MICO|nr:glycine cleavage T C-terminal barrel domain-containing protein [Leifsonia williamsii]MDN4616053.1 glycine cleavage T C-terminal barrel domain-containing protein [Leifsonia williamsii]
MASPFLGLPGAVDIAETGVPAHYGNPLAEQRALAEGRAIVDLSDRAVLTVTGPDRLSWLNSLTSQALTGLQPGESSETLLLDVTGRVEHAARIVEDGETVWLLVDRPEAEGLRGWLDSMRFMLRVEVADRTDEYATIGTLGEPDLPAAVSNGVPLVWHDPWHAVTPGGHQYARGEHPGADWSWSERLVPRDALAGIVDRVAAGEFAAAGTLAADALRIAAWRPRFSTEVDERTIPHELDWLRTAVHLTKGCYRGQETVAKVHNLGHPPRRLVMLHLDGSEGVHPAQGAVVSLDGKEVGAVTSSALHYELGPIALAVVKRGTDAAATLTVDADGTAVAAAQEVVVPPEAGAEADVPRLPRLGAVTRKPRG